MTRELAPTVKRCVYPHRYVLREEEIPGIKPPPLQAAVKNIRFLNRHLKAHGPVYPGDRFNLIDLNMADW